MSMRRRIRLIDAELPVGVGKPIRHPDLPVMTVSGEAERLRVVVVDGASWRRCPVLHRRSATDYSLAP